VLVFFPDKVIGITTKWNSPAANAVQRLLDSTEADTSEKRTWRECQQNPTFAYLLKALNETRAKVGLPPLTPSMTYNL
jgi:uncharacterized protein YkwD